MKIAILNFSAALTQRDCIQGRNKGRFYYDAQKSTLISYLVSRFPKRNISIIGLSTGLHFEVEQEEGIRFVKLPCLLYPLISDLMFNLISFLYLLFNKKPSIVYAYGGGATWRYLGGLLYAKLSRVPLFIDLRNPPYSLCCFRPLRFYEKTVLKAVDITCLKHSDVIVHISERAKKLLKSSPELFQKSIVASSCAHDVFFKEYPIKRTEEVTFAYWGIMIRMRRLDSVIRGFVKAKKLNDKFNAKLFMIGDGEELDRLKGLAKELNASNIIFKGYIKREGLCRLLRKISVAVIPVPRAKFFYYSSPIKLAEAIALCIPVVASDIKPHEIVREHKLGILCNHDETSYAEAFLKMYASDLNEFKKRCYKIRHLFSPPIVFKELGRVMWHVIKV